MCLNELRLNGFDLFNMIGRGLSLRSSSWGGLELAPGSSSLEEGTESPDWRPTVGLIGTDDLVDSVTGVLGPAGRVVSVQRGQASLGGTRGDLDIVVAELLPDDGNSGVDAGFAMELLRGASTAVELVLIAERRSLLTLIRANTSASVDFLIRPYPAEELALRLRHAVDRAASRRWARHLEAALDSLQLAIRAREVPPIRADLARLTYRDAMQIASERAAREYLSALMSDVNGNVAKAARRAGLERESLHRILKRSGIQGATFKKKPG